MLDWTLDLVFAKDLVQFITLRAPVVSHVDNGEHMTTVSEAADRSASGH